MGRLLGRRHLAVDAGWGEDFADFYRAVVVGLVRLSEAALVRSRFPGL